MIIENNIRNTLDRVNCSADVFCALGGISPTRWSRALRGLAPLTGPECQALSNLAEELSQLTDDAKPIPVDFRDLEAIKLILEQRRNGQRWVTCNVGGSPEV